MAQAIVHLGGLFFGRCGNFGARWADFISYQPYSEFGEIPVSSFRFFSLYPYLVCWLCIFVQGRLPAPLVEGGIGSSSTNHGNSFRIYITEGYCFDAEKIMHWMPLPPEPRTWSAFTLVFKTSGDFAQPFPH